jgi:hypothetical protein
MKQPPLWKTISLGTYTRATFVVAAAFGLAACGSSSEEDGTGFLKFYNASPNAPAMFITLDEDLDNDEDDEIEQTFSNINYGQALSNQQIPTGEYFYELAWQDEESNARSDLEIVFEDRLTIEEDDITLVVMSDDILQPQVTVFNVPIVDDEDDSDNDLFNLRFLNASPDNTAIDVYMSKSDETFNESELMGSFSYLELSENIKRDEDQYIFYITQAGSTEVLFESSDVNYPFSSQYIVVIRPSTGAGESPYVIDNVSNSTVTEYQSANAAARFRVYNGMQTNDLFPQYTGQLTVAADLDPQSVDDIVDQLAVSTFSDSFTVANGDYSLTLKNADTDEELLKNQLLSLPENTDKTVFYYLIEEFVDEDGDGDFDEDGDGEVDEIEVKIATTVVDNSTRERIYDHEVEMLNLAYSEDFARVTFYFVKSDEIIDTAENRRTLTLGDPSSLVLLNNTYQVYAVAEIDGNDIILDTLSLTLNEDSDELFLLFEQSATAPSGYQLKFESQRVGE